VRLYYSPVELRALQADQSSSPSVLVAFKQQLMKFAVQLLLLAAGGPTQGLGRPHAAQWSLPLGGRGWACRASSRGHAPFAALLLLAVALQLLQALEQVGGHRAIGAGLDQLTEQLIGILLGFDRVEPRRRAAGLPIRYCGFSSPGW